MRPTRPFVVVALIASAALSRLLPHPPNATPIAAMALFGGAYLTDRRLALLIPLAAMLVSDLVLGLHPLLPVVYGAFVLTVLLGRWLRGRITPLRVATATLASSVLFFVVTNAAVWAWGGLYPKTPTGLAAAYIAAIPFFRNTLVGDAAYTVVLFGGYALLERLALGAARRPHGRNVENLAAAADRASCRSGRAHRELHTRSNNSFILRMERGTG